MDCRTFQEMLPRYLAGELEAETFDLMVAHEAACEVCHALAAHEMGVGPEAEPTAARVAQPVADAKWLAETLRRTVGNDCDYIRQRVAAELDETPAADIARRVTEHLAGCAGCRALAAQLRALPDFYATLPQLEADRSFAREIAARTLPPRAGWLEVMRSWLRRPEALWEGAVVCALLLTPLAGDSFGQWLTRVQSVGRDVGESLALPDHLTALGQSLSSGSEKVRVTLAGSQQSVENQWVQARQGAEHSVNDAIHQCATADPRIAAGLTWMKCALGRVGLYDSEDACPPDTVSTPEGPTGGSSNELQKP